MGIINRQYCPLIGQYISVQPVALFGIMFLSSLAFDVILDITSEAILQNNKKRRKSMVTIIKKMISTVAGLAFTGWSGRHNPKL